MKSFGLQYTKIYKGQDVLLILYIYLFYLYIYTQMCNSEVMYSKKILVEHDLRDSIAAPSDLGHMSFC